MKAFKIFKKRDEDVIDVQTLSAVSHAELCQIVIKFHSELKEASHAIESYEESSKLIKKELLTSNEELQLYKTHCEELQNVAQRLSVENESFNTLIQSKTQEIKYFRDKTNELEKNSENAKNISAILNELEAIKAKNSENLEKINAMASEKEISKIEKLQNENEIKSLKTRAEEINKKNQDLEMSLKAKHEEYYKIKSDNKLLKNKLKQTEAIVKDQDAVIKGKDHRISELESNYESLSNSLKTKSEKLESYELSFESTINSYKAEVQKKDHQIQQLQKKAEEDLKKEIEKNDLKLNKTIEDYKLKITMLELENSNNQTEISKLRSELQQVFNNLKNCQEILESVQKKRELAKQEVLKLTQKLESNNIERVPVKPQPTSSQNIVSGSLSEYKGLQILKSQLDILYKALMDLMLSANTIRDPHTRVTRYQISSEEFSKFEKDLNKVVMNVHEATDNPNFIETNQGWIGKISNWGPSKLLSCMSNNNRVPSANPPEKRRASYKGFF